MEQGFGVCDALTVCKRITEVEQVCEEYACARNTNIKALETLGDAIYGVPKIGGPQNTTCLMKRTLQKGTPHFGKPHIGSCEDYEEATNKYVSQLVRCHRSLKMQAFRV